MTRRRPSNVARRAFVWTIALALIGMWTHAIAEHQSQWPIAGVMALLIFVYVTAASAEQVVALFVNSGVRDAVTGGGSNGASS